MNKTLFLSSILLLISSYTQAQSSPIPRGNYAYSILDRLEILSGIEAPYHSSLKYYARDKVTQFALQLDTLTSVQWGILDRNDLEYLFLDNNEWLGQANLPNTLGGPKYRPQGDSTLSMIAASLQNVHYQRSKRQLFKWLYPSPANLFEVNTPAFHLRLNPVLNLQLGRSAAEQQPYLQYSRGLELRGGIDDRVFVYMNLLENQAQYPQYVRDYYNQTGALPGVALVKNYRSQLLNINNGYDFLLSDGYVGFNLTPHIGSQVGFGRNFIGNGYRSLLLSDWAANYFYLKFNWQIWKFHFQNLFAEMVSSSPNISSNNIIERKKYMASHHLSINLGKKLNLGLFETVMFSREDHFEFHYLNPVIFYRAVEQGLGSPDNVILGFDGKWNLFKKVQLYGQLTIDEFLFNRLISDNRGYWANKYALQMGLKYVNALGVDHLDLQLEYNLARPYTYAHFDTASSYTQLHQPLAHPLGANFKELVLLLRYQPLPRMVLDLRYLRANFGEDGPSDNWGSNILLNNYRFQQEYGNVIGQGIAAQTSLLGIDLSYHLAHNVFLDLQYFYRRKDSADNARDQKAQFISAGVRVNMGKIRLDF
jgi:hypothetical protein